MLNRHFSQIHSVFIFPQRHNQIFSASYDRTIKLFDLSIFLTSRHFRASGLHYSWIVYVQKLPSPPAPETSPARFWKVAEESQLVFRGGGVGQEILEGMGEGDRLDGEERITRGSTVNTVIEGCLDVVAMIDETNFSAGEIAGELTF